MSSDVRQIESNKLDLANAKTVVVRKQIFVIKEGNPITGCKISNFDSPENLIKTMVAPLQHERDEHIEQFSVCNLMNKKVILTGGRNGRFRSAKSYALDVLTS